MEHDGVRRLGLMALVPDTFCANLTCPVKNKVVANLKFSLLPNVPQVWEGGAAIARNIREGKTTGSHQQPRSLEALLEISMCSGLDLQAAMPCVCWNQRNPILYRHIWSMLGASFKRHAHPVQECEEQEVGFGVAK